jgi:hypothetical protein
MRRQAVGLLVAAQAAHREKEEAVEKARRLKHGWMVTIDDMVSMQAACQQVRALGTAASGPASTAADVALRHWWPLQAQWWVGCWTGPRRRR